MENMRTVTDSHTETFTHKFIGDLTTFTIYYSTALLYCMQLSLAPN